MVAKSVFELSRAQNELNQDGTREWWLSRSSTVAHEESHCVGGFREMGFLLHGRSADFQAKKLTPSRDGAGGNTGLARRRRTEQETVDSSSWSQRFAAIQGVFWVGITPAREEPGGGGRSTPEVIGVRPDRR